MRQSLLFSKTRKEAPRDEEARNAKLLIRAGFIHKEMAGVYTYLPLGLRVLKNIEEIIREEMEVIGGVEVLMTTLQDPHIWQKTDRWDDRVVDNWFKTKLAGGGDLGIANTHEEPLVSLLTHFVSSHRDLPLAIFQFQTKFRNELRAKSGIMRTREFIMKDLYSFSRTEEEFKHFYETCAGAYRRIFDRTGIGHVTYRTAAAGGSFTLGLTDEFQTLTDAGEDVIFLDENQKFAINKEINTEENRQKTGLDQRELIEKKSVEVGNIFPLGTKYAEALDLFFTDDKGERKPVIMGSYGIGLGRVMGAIVEVLSDERGIVWPRSVAPFAAHLLVLAHDEGKGVHTAAETLYATLERAEIQVLYDDRAMSAGEKFADADLIGIPWRIVVSEKTCSENKYELHERTTKEARLVTEDELIRVLKR